MLPRKMYQDIPILMSMELPHVASRFFYLEKQHTFPNVECLEPGAMQGKSQRVSIRCQKEARNRDEKGMHPRRQLCAAIGIAG